MTDRTPPLVKRGQGRDDHLTERDVLQRSYLRDWLTCTGALGAWLAFLYMVIRYLGG